MAFKDAANVGDTLASIIPPNQQPSVIALLISIIHQISDERDLFGCALGKQFLWHIVYHMLPDSTTPNC